MLITPLACDHHLTVIPESFEGVIFSLYSALYGVTVISIVI